MSFVGFQSGGGGGPAGSPAVNRGRIGMNGQGMSYPSPFFDLAQTYLPTSFKEMFRMCRYYFLTNPLINAVAFKMSEYPITDIAVDHADPQVCRRWTELIQDQLRYRAFQVESGLDYHVYGNAMVSLGYPLVKYLSCTRCRFQEIARSIRQHWTFTSFNYRLTCPRCGHQGDAAVHDAYPRNANAVRLLRWNVEDIDISYNSLSGEELYFYNMPGKMRNDIVAGKKEIVDSIPAMFVQALREQKSIVLNNDRLFHLRRPTLAQMDRGWGIPPILCVLKDAYYLQVMKKAQESLLVESIVPLRILFPQAGSSSSDVYSSTNLVDWRDAVAGEIRQWRRDPNYIPIVPLPIGNQTIGGDGKAMLLTAEMQALMETIINGMGVPKEFIFGGAQWSGTQVSMRMVENAFLGYIQYQRQLLRMIVRDIASFMDWPEVKVRFLPFKMADDLQRKAYNFQLQQAGIISKTTLATDSGFDFRGEMELVDGETSMALEATKKQQLGMAQQQGEAQLLQMKMQAKAQQAMQTAQMAPPAPGEPGGMEQGSLGSAPGADAQAPVELPPELQVTGPGGEAIQANPQGIPDTATSPLNAGQNMNRQDLLQGGAPGQDAQQNASLQYFAQSEAARISALPSDQQQQALNALRVQSPELADMVKQFMAQGAMPQQAAGPPGATAGVDMRPMPEKLPPRRQGGG